MQYSPKLKKAMEEIKAIFKKYDVGGTCVIHTPGFSEYIIKINPSYSCARIENDHLIVNVKAEHFNGDKKLRDQFVADTANMLNLMGETTGRVALNIMNVSKELDRRVQSEHFRGGHSSHTQQNN